MSTVEQDVGREKEVYVGEPKVLRWLIEDDQARHSRWNISGWTFLFQVRLTRYSATVFLEKAGTAFGPGADGVAQVSFDDDDTKTLVPGTYYYGLARSNVGNFDVVAEGKFVLRQAAVHAPWSGGCLMGWTYSGDPATSTLDEVRFLVGDTDDADQQVTNEEVEYLIASAGSANAAAVAAAVVLATRYSGLAKSKAVGDLRIEYESRAEGYRALIKKLETGGVSGSTAHPIAYAGGISISDKEAQEDDDDRVEPGFVVDDGSRAGDGIGTCSGRSDDRGSTSST